MRALALSVCFVAACLAMACSFGNSGGSAAATSSGTESSGAGSTSNGSTSSAAGASSGSATGSGATTSSATGASGSSTGAAAPSVSAQTLGIIVNTSDALSVAVGARYQAARGIPARNVFDVSFPRANTLDSATFASLRQGIDADGGVDLQAFVLTWTFPYIVQDDAGCKMSITSAFALGYGEQWCVDDSVRCDATALSPYYASSSTAPYTDYGIRPTMMLAGNDLTQVSTLIARGLAADGTAPMGDADLVITPDAVRSVRAAEFRELANLWDAGETGIAVDVIDNSKSTTADGALVDAGTVLFYLVGLATVPGLGSNQYLPGAVGDSLTSFGGVLSGAGQTTVLDWLAAGLTASSGTVREPCNYVQKFSNPEVLVPAYRGGDTLVEAYWKSVQFPGELLFVGEPLARPWSK